MQIHRVLKAMHWPFRWSAPGFEKRDQSQATQSRSISTEVGTGHLPTVWNELYIVFCDCDCVLNTNTNIEWDTATNIDTYTSHKVKVKLNQGGHLLCLANRFKWSLSWISCSECDCVLSWEIWEKFHISGVLQVGVHYWSSSESRSVKERHRPSGSKIHWISNFDISLLS